ncbi:glycosyltransferase [Desulfovibrio sp. OttesenSCG-928-G11]|nr:glycosyltransferase [Desulfovibrio sp. OttesenSCG-928-G11]
MRDPWNHPWLGSANLREMRAYSEKVWDFALAHAARFDRPLSLALSNNMAQSMYKWSCMLARQGHKVRLFSRSDDKTAFSAPQWEEFDGNAEDLYAQAWQEEQMPKIPLAVPHTTHCTHISWEAAETWRRWVKEADYASFFHFYRTKNLNPAPFLLDLQVSMFAEMAQDFQGFDAAFGTMDIAPLYLSGTPYSFFSAGGDLDIICSRRDAYGDITRLAAESASFAVVSNPHAVGHLRRLGLTNGLYLPYPMDDGKYCPGPGKARKEWEAAVGQGLFVLVSSRLEKKVKGFDNNAWQALFAAAERSPDLRFVFIMWGTHAEETRRQLEDSPLCGKVVFLKPAGKVRLIDYYRSCDVVLDQLKYGYYGATALEAAACGKPVIMFIREEQYSPLYNGDVAPVENVLKHSDITAALIRLAQNRELRLEHGKAMREWLVRNHGEQKTAPLLAALLRLTADGARLPKSLQSPLLAPVSEKEAAFNTAYEDWDRYQEQDHED